MPLPSLELTYLGCNVSRVWKTKIFPHHPPPTQRKKPKRWGLATKLISLLEMLMGLSN